MKPAPTKQLHGYTHLTFDVQNFGKEFFTVSTSRSPQRPTQNCVFTRKPHEVAPKICFPSSLFFETLVAISSACGLFGELRSYSSKLFYHGETKKIAGPQINPEKLILNLKRLPPRYSELLLCQRKKRQGQLFRPCFQCDD